MIMSRTVVAEYVWDLRTLCQLSNAFMSCRATHACQEKYMWRIPAVAAAGAADVAADGLEAKWRESMRFVPRRSLARARERSVCLSRQAAGGRIFLCDRK